MFLKQDILFRKKKSQYMHTVLWYMSLGTLIDPV